MTAALHRSAARSEPPSALRPVNPRRDMAQLADLLQTAFRGRLDRVSLHMVRDMKRFGQAGWIGWLLGHLFLPPAAYPHGFVWEKEGKIIGNASLMPVDNPQGRWVLANVAVHPDHRRAGIATRLVRTCLSHVSEQEGDEVLLQVDHDNRGAILLYQRLGFHSYSTRTTWHRPADEPLGRLAEHPQVSDRSPAQWRLHWQLAARVAPEGVIWPYPLRQDWFLASRWDGLRGATRTQHWLCLTDSGDISGALTAILNASNSAWHLAMLCDPDATGEVEVPLLESALKELRGSRLPLALDYAAGPADGALRRLGFRHRRTMVWMGKKIGD